MGPLNTRLRSCTLMCHWLHDIMLLPPATKLQQGNVLTSVCDSVHGGSFSGRPPWTETPLDMDPPGQRLPRTEIPPGQGPSPLRCTVMSGRCASYWNAFLSSND